ncbi:hypothetical protein RN001_004547 [Aquatica leii]|uniref:Aminopeptidase n=1 Tax=Aquatica leii TaxID=1421715 RepID=A0AAN7PBR6_9COLE|nr:hypothetical protein RN001_004547 [Aquatica leii]
MGGNKAGFNSTRSEFESDTENSKDSNVHKRNGCFVSTKKAIILAAFAILSLLAVGAIIYFYGAKYNKHQDDSNDLEALLNTSLNNIQFQDFRLPTHVRPLHYRLRIHPFLNEIDASSFKFYGEVTILINCEKPTKTIILHSDQLQIVKHEVMVATRKDVFIKALQKFLPGTDFSNKSDQTSEYNSTLNDDAKSEINYVVPKTIYLEIEQHEEIPKMSRYIIHLSSELEPGTNYTLDIKFSGKISDNLLGLYRSSYLDSDGNKRWILNTHLQPIFARRIFPCFDEPSFKASFEISIARKTSMSSVSNMPLKESEIMQNKSGWIWDHFDTSPPMSPHLLAFTVFDFDFIKPNSSEIGSVFKLWAPKHLLANAQYAVNIGPKILYYLQHFFGIKFPLSKIDLVVIPELYQTAIENWGLITFRENAILLDSSSDSWETKNYIFKTITGKLSKQWFGNLVTMHWWSDIWLSEGFSTYMEDVVENTLDPALEDLDTFSMRVTQTILDSDKLKSVQSLQVNIKDPTQIEQLFDDVAYNKGSCLIRMLNCTISETSFKKGIQNYLKTNTSIDDFWNSFYEIDKNTTMLPNDVSIKEFMDTWITQDGYPILSVERNYENGTAVINQKGFVNFHNTNNHLWHIPITYTQDGTDTVNSMWMKNTPSMLVENFTIPNSNKWVVFNVEGTGLYRVNYDNNNWKLLQNQLKIDSSKISATNRGQLLNDAIELSNIGMLNYSTAFELAKYLKHNESNLIPWHSFFNSLKPTTYIMQRTEYFGIFEDYILNLIKPTFEKLGHTQSLNESQNNKLLRSFIIKKACDYNYEPCLSWSRKHFHNWMNSPDPDKHIPISFGLRDAVLCSAIKTSGKKEWNFLWERTLYQLVSMANLKIFYNSLGCTRQPWLINNYLAKTLNGSIALQNTKIVWKSLSHPVGLSVGFAYLRTNWKKIYQNSEHLFSNLNTIFEEFLTKLSTKIDLEDLTVFYKNNKKELLPVSSLMLRLVDKIKWRINWVEMNIKTVVNWMLQNT